MILFNKHVVNIHKSDMEKKITTISQRLSDYISGNKHMMPGLGAYIKLLDDIAMTDVWLVDNNMNIITSKSSNNETPTLPSSGDYAIKEAFKGKISFSENFSDILNTKTLTASAPIYSNGNIVACVLLHSPVEGITSITKNGISILIISIVLSLFISIFISIALAVYFTKPLNKMKHTANLLSTGNYTAKTNIKQNDEIGDLAKSIDILSEKLKEAAYESEKLDKMRKDFISNISHELRTPVTVIRGSLEALSDGIIKDPEKIKEYYNQMLSESIQLQRLINDLLDLSRLQNLDFKIETTPLNILDVVNDSIRSMRQISNKKI